MALAVPVRETTSIIVPRGKRVAEHESRAELVERGVRARWNGLHWWSEAWEVGR